MQLRCTPQMTWRRPTPRVTSNTNKGGARYDRDIIPRMFAFVNTDFFTDALQDLNLRSVVGGGLGFHAIKTPSTTLDLLGGIKLHA